MTETKVLKISNLWDEKLQKKVQKLITKNQKYNVEIFDKKKQTYFKRGFRCYEVRWYDFLPLYIGFVISWFQLAYVYGVIRSTSGFDNHLYKKFLQKYIWALLIYFVYLVSTVSVILFFAPLMTVQSSVFFNVWANVGSSDFFSVFYRNIMVPFLFHSKAWLWTLLIFIIYPIFNLPHLLCALLLNYRSYSYVKYLILDDILKLKPNRFVKKIKG